MSGRRRIAVVTGTRAEYGLLSHVMRALAARSDVELLVVVTGTHLDARFGATVDEIERDGFAIAARVPMQLKGDSGRETAHAMASVMHGMADALGELVPDMLVLLGDRFELLAVAGAATMLSVPIAHIHGGEITEGAIDDGIRHALTKLAHLHFAAAPPYRDRILQMGEMPERVILAGALAVDAVACRPRLERTEVERRLGLALDGPLLLVTYHPVTLDGAAGGAGVEPLIAALERFDATVVITGANADPAHSVITARLAAFAAARPGRVVLRTSLGQQLYLSVMALADAVVGNSSSGVIEAPIMRLPTVNIGDRQAGRLLPASVITCAPEAASIEAAIRKALTPEFRQQCTGADFGTPGVAGRIAGVLASVELSALRRKRFRDDVRH